MFTYLGLIINWLKAKQTQPCPRVQTKQRRGQTHNQFQHQKSKVKILPQTHPHHFTVVFGVVFFFESVFSIHHFCHFTAQKRIDPKLSKFFGDHTKQWWWLWRSISELVVHPLARYGRDAILEPKRQRFTDKNPHLISDNTKFWWKYHFSCTTCIMRIKYLTIV